MRILLLVSVFFSALTTASAAKDDESWDVVKAPRDGQAAALSKKASAAAAAEAPAKEPAPICPASDVPFLPTGFRFPALLPDAIYSYNAVAPTTALIEEDIKFLDRVVIPKKSYLVGTVGTVHSDDRVNIKWSLLVTPQGCEIPFSGIALDAADGAAGVKGVLKTHKDSMAAQLMLKSVLSGAASVASVGGVAPVEGAVLSNFSGEANTMVDQNMAKIQSLDSVDVRERTPIRIFTLHRFLREVK